jgi:ABC-type glycerol-3-phosphate transport system substrate-binding protein
MIIMTSDLSHECLSRLNRIKKGEISMKKWFSLLLAMCLVLPMAALADEGDNVVRVACGTGQYEMWYRALEEKCEAETGLEIEFVEVSGGLEAVMMEYLSGGASNIDVWNIDGPNIPEMAKNGYILPMTDYMSEESKADFFPVALDAVSYDGVIYASPYVVHGLSLFYNKKMFEEAGITEIPTTIEGITEAARKLTDPEKGVYGIAVEGAQHEEPAGHLIDWIVRFGGEGLLDKEGNLVFGDQATIDTFQWLHDLVYVEKVAPPECVSWLNGETATALQQGRIAMCLNWPYLYEECKKADATAEDVLGNIGVIALPPTNCVWAWCWGISSTSKNPDNAAKFIEWACNEEQITNIGTELLIPVCRASAKANIQASSDLNDADREASQNLTETLEQGYAPGLSTNYSSLRSTIGETLSYIMTTEDVDIAAAVAQCTAELQELLAELEN